MMQVFSLRSSMLAALVFSALLLTAGCRSGDSFNTSSHAAAWNASKLSARRELSQLPLPSKSTYLAVDQPGQWQNPFLTVQTNMIQLRIYVADENSSSFDRGGMTRLRAARKHIVNIRLRDLPRALAALPDQAWPYGRVVAVGVEAGSSGNRPRVRANLATTIAALKDMGLVVDDWTQPRR